MTMFITGATGYIGGAIAAHLTEAGYTVRGLVRSEEKAALLADRGIIPVLGSLDDTDILIDEARNSEGVINAADSDHRPAVEALIEGLAGSGKPFLHTSGSGLFANDARGDYASATIFDDNALMDSFTPITGMNERASIDLFVRDAAKRGIRSVVLCNTNIYGWGKGPHTESIQVPWLLAEARKSGVARYVGKGESIWSNVHIEDVANLYMIALKQAPAGSFYFVENGEASFLQTAVAISKRLRLAEPESWSVDEATKECGEGYAFVFGSNCRVRGNRSRSELNWQPKHKSLQDWIEKEG